jgi:hypothetical protein
MGVMKINGIGSDALTSPAITDYGTCPAALKQPTPYRFVIAVSYHRNIE